MCRQRSTVVAIWESISTPFLSLTWHIQKENSEFIKEANKVYNKSSWCISCCFIAAKTEITPSAYKLIYFRAEQFATGKFINFKRAAIWILLAERSFVCWFWQALTAANYISRWLGIRFWGTFTPISSHLDRLAHTMLCFLFDTPGSRGGAASL